MSKSFYIKNLILVCTSLFLLAGCSPKTYEDCLLQNIKPGLSDEAVKAVYTACEAKEYSSVSGSGVPCSPRNLTQNELSQLRKSAEIDTGTRILKVTVYNGNNRMIQDVSINLIGKDGSSQIYKLPLSNVSSNSEATFYQKILSIEPESISRVVISGAEMCSK